MKMRKLKNGKGISYKGIIVEPQIRDFFFGRIRNRQTVPFPKQKIDNYIHNLFFIILPGITKMPSKFFQRQSFLCNQCKNSNEQEFIQFHCAKCERICVYCRHCINMGRMTSCTELLMWIGPKPLNPGRYNGLDWNGQLTEAQKQAANQLENSIMNKKNHLVHAVCGAGKTEILFPMVLSVLKRGWRICIATPRTDVVLELAPRFHKVFPNTNLHAYYGNSPEQKGFPQLVIATTHQLYRFENTFDVIVVDEADAFPYNFDISLQRAVLKAKKKDAPIALVTATPSNKILNKVKKEQWGHSFIPKRFHGYPLPVPRFESLWSYGKSIKKGKLPQKLLQWTITRLEKKEPFLIFFPTIELMQVATPLFQQLDERILSVHAEDVDRKEKVLKLRNEKIPGLLTTTILERGITIKNVQVAVVGVESTIFTSSALIQISGRVGRNPQYPNGEIVFFHHGITTEMDEARNEIVRLNREGVWRNAKKRGV